MSLPVIHLKAHLLRIDDMVDRDGIHKALSRMNGTPSIVEHISNEKIHKYFLLTEVSNHSLLYVV